MTHDENNKDQVILSQRETIQLLKAKVAGMESDLRDAQQDIGDAALIGHMRGADQATDKWKVERDALRSRVAELEDAIRGIVLCTKEPGGACVCIQYAETILNKK